MFQQKACQKEEIPEWMIVEAWMMTDLILILVSSEYFILELKTNHS
jgi:hypothetical protein